MATVLELKVMWFAILGLCLLYAIMFTVEITYEACGYYRGDNHCVNDPSVGVLSINGVMFFVMLILLVVIRMRIGSQLHRPQVRQQAADVLCDANGRVVYRRAAPAPAPAPAPAHTAPPPPAPAAYNAAYSAAYDPRYGQAPPSYNVLWKPGQVARASGPPASTAGQPAPDVYEQPTSTHVYSQERPGCVHCGQPPTAPSMARF